MLLWVRNIVCYLIVLTVVSELLANSRYERYLRFFSGLVLIVLVVSPLSDALCLTDTLDDLFSAITFSQESDDFQERIWGMEEERKKRLAASYEEVLAREVEEMAREEGLLTENVTAVIDENGDSPSYGRVETFSIRLKKEGRAREQAVDAAVEASEITSVHVGAIAIGDSNISQNTAELDDPAVEAWRGKVAERYGLERANIRVEWADE